jgi:hypothetical protein
MKKTSSFSAAIVAFALGALTTGCSLCEGNFHADEITSLDAIRGCEEITGSLWIHTSYLGGAEEIDLPNLRRVEGMLTIGGGDELKRVLLPNLEEVLNDDAQQTQIGLSIGATNLQKVDLSSLTRAAGAFALEGPIEELPLGPIEEAGRTLTLMDLVVEELDFSRVPTMYEVSIQRSKGLSRVDLSTANSGALGMNVLVLLNESELTLDISGATLLDRIEVSQNQADVQVVTESATQAMGGILIDANEGVSRLDLGPAFADLEGLEITDNNGFVSASGSAVERIGSLLIQQNPDLESLSFPNLTTVERSFEITGNGKLPNCQAETLFQQIEGSLGFHTGIYYQNLDDGCPDKQS